MTTSEAGIKMIKKYEGFRNMAYLDPANVWTIGYGHTNGVKSGMVCTKEQATEWLKQDLRSAEKSVDAIERWGYTLNQNQFDALVSFTFNCGAGNLAKLCDGGSRPINVIAQKILLYNKANGKILAGLTKRRREESELLLKECQSDKLPYIIECVNIKQYGVRSNYNIRESPSINAIVVSNTSKVTITKLLARVGDWIETEHGWINKEAFYDKFL